MKFKHILRILLVWLALYLSIVYLDGISLRPAPTLISSYMILFTIFAGVELLLYPVMRMLILPLRILTLGFASAVLSVNIVYIVAFVLPFFSITVFWQAVLLGAGIGIARILTR